MSNSANPAELDQECSDVKLRELVFVGRFFQLSLVLHKAVNLLCVREGFAAPMLQGEYEELTDATAASDGDGRLGTASGIPIYYSDFRPGKKEIAHQLFMRGMAVLAMTAQRNRACNIPMQPITDRSRPIEL